MAKKAAVRSQKDQSSLRTRAIKNRQYIWLGLIAFFSVFPFYWMFVISSNNSAAINERPPAVIPGENFLTSVAQVNEIINFAVPLVNSLLVASVVAASQVFFSTLAGFAFAKLRFPGRNGLFVFVLATMMVPTGLGIIPFYLMMSNLGLINTLGSVILPGLTTAFGVFWMRQTIEGGVPDELIEAARIDGASNFRIYRSIVMPSIAPTAGVLGLFGFLAAWNDFMWPLLSLNSPENFTVQVAVRQLRSAYFVDYSIQMTGAFLATVPLLILFALVARRMVAGVMAGAIKG
ncbi:MAG: carbohydrate ABC transporter permease [Aquiluna sp.]|nr:carbohydrate ABC transporter permease [Aquiluna sp.]